MLNRRHVLISVGAALAAGPVAAAQPLSPVEQQLAAILDEMFSEALAERPELATSLGLDTGANASAKSKLRSASIAAIDRRKSQTLSQLKRLEAIDRGQLTGTAALNYDAVHYDLATTAAADQRFTYGEEGAGSPYVLSQINGAYQEVPDFLASQHTIETAADAEAYLARLEAFAGLMIEEVARVRRDIRLGVIPPDFAISAALGQMRTLHAPAAQSTLVMSLVTRARAKGLEGDWQGRAAAVYERKVLPALRRQMALLKRLQRKAGHEAGVWRLPDGEAYYAQALQAQTTTSLTAAQVHQLGLEVTRTLSDRADVLFRQMGMSDGTVAERYGALFKDPRFIYPNTDAGKEKEINDLNEIIQTMQKRLPEYFATLPKAALLIQRIPAATEAGASTHYTDGSLDGTRPGIYWLNLRDTAEAPFWDMPTTTYHEGSPGHHLQGSVALQADLPMIRKVGGFGAYVEGWALYAEQLAQEMGMYADNPAAELGYIHDALLRSGRLVTDTGLHSLRWTREQATAALSAIDGDLPAMAAQEIERYSVWPGQACSYMVGKLTILKQRARAMTALETRFDIRQFHDAVLLGGPMPLAVLEDAVGRYITARRA